MIDKFLQTLYDKLFVNIVLEGKKSTVYIELCSSGKSLDMLDNARMTFESDGLNNKMVEFIESYTRQTPYFYVSILDTSINQGALPTCDASRFSKFHDMSECEYRCVERQWSYYTSKSDIRALERKYQKVGLDFIFSPFTILSHFFKDKIETTFAMFVLVQANQITVSVFDHGSLLFAQNLDMQYVPEESGLVNSYLDDDLELDLEDGIDLEGIDVDSEEMQLIDDFGDIEDLDSLEEIEEFSEQKDFEDISYKAPLETPSSLPTQGSFNEDYQRFTLVQFAIAEYYQDSRYESRFIENIYVADGVAMSTEFKRYLEEELFVNVYVRRCDISLELCEQAKLELHS